VTAGNDGRFIASGLSLGERPRPLIYGEVLMRKGTPWLRIDREVANVDWQLDTGGAQVQHGDAVEARIAEGKVVLNYHVAPGEDRSLECVIARICAPSSP